MLYPTNTKCAKIVIIIIIIAVVVFVICITRNYVVG